MGLADYIGKYWAGAEVLYGVIIAMTFTSVLRGDLALLQPMLGKTLLAALSCCIAWGIADGLFYSWERGYLIRQENRIIGLSGSSGQQESAVSLVREELDDTILRNIPPEHRLKLYRQLVQYLSGVNTREKVTAYESLTIMMGTLVRSAGAGLVVATPFFLVHDVRTALNLSNLAGIVLLFGIGYSRALGRSLFPRIGAGIGTSLVGIAIAGITVVLGG